MAAIQISTSDPCKAGPDLDCQQVLRLLAAKISAARRSERARVARLAYQLAEQQQFGGDMAQHWLRAEAMIVNNAQPSAAEAQATSRV